MDKDIKVKVKSLSHARLLVTPWTAAYQAPPSMEAGKSTPSIFQARVLEWGDIARYKYKYIFLYILSVLFLFRTLTAATKLIHLTLNSRPIISIWPLVLYDKQ